MLTFVYLLVIVQENSIFLGKEKNISLWTKFTFLLRLKIQGKTIQETVQD